MLNLCSPAIIYLIFSTTQILIDTLKGLYNTAMMKVIVTIMVTLLLNILCQQGLTVVSWIIVFIPFILMSVIVTLLLYAFGLDVSSGKLNYTCENTTSNNISIDRQGNLVIYDPEYNSNRNPVYYKSPNIIVPNPTANDIKNSLNIYPNISSSPAYKS